MMSIFQEFKAAITEALNAYEAEKQRKGQAISDVRKKDLITLRQILNQTEQEITAIGLRAAIVKFVEGMYESIWANMFTVLESDLKRKIIAKLEAFPKSVLTEKTYLEIKNNQILLATAPDGTNLLKRNEELACEKDAYKARAELAIKMNKSLEVTCTQLEARCTALINDKAKLQAEFTELVNSLKDQSIRLSQIVLNLEARINELNKTIIEQDKVIADLKHTNSELIKEKEVLETDFESLQDEYSKSLKSFESLRGFLKQKGISEEELSLFEMHESANQSIFSLNINS